MSIKLTETELKTEVENIQTNFKDLEEALKDLESEKEPKIHYMFDEFQRHGQELIDFLTDKKIEELYEKK